MPYLYVLLHNNYNTCTPGFLCKSETMATELDALFNPNTHNRVLT